MLKKKYSFPTFLLLTLIFVAPLFKMEYATDTYTMASSGFLPSAEHMLYNNGRALIAAFYYLCDFLSISIQAFYYFSLLLAIISISLAIYRLFKLFSRDFAKLPAFFFAILFVLNPITTEYLLFIEKGFFFLAILLCVFALEGFCMLTDGRRRGLAISLICILLASFIYQSIPGGFLLMCALFALLKSNSAKKLFINLALSLGIYGFGAFCNLIFLRLLRSSSRLDGDFSVSNIIKAVFLLDFYTVFIYLALALLLLALCIVLNKRTSGKPFSKELFHFVFASFLLCFIGVGITIAPFALVAENEVWITFRIIYPIGVLVFALPYYFCAKDKNTFKSKASRRGSFLLLFILVLNFAFFQTMIISRIINNETDKALCEKIGEEISLYENESGIDVKNVKIYYDRSTTKKNAGVLKIGDSNVRAFSKTWSDVCHMNVILGRSLVKCSPDKKYVDYFSKKDYSAYDREQLIFEGDTLHICVY